jgi:hypothetical protein
MIFKYKNHADLVDDWVKQNTGNLSSEQLLELFEQAFTTLYKGTRVMISGIFLTAVLDRVVFTCSENYPFLSSIKVTEEGLQFEKFRQSTHSFDKKKLIAAFKEMMTEFIVIFANLTNEVITPTLYHQLSKVKLESKLKTIKIRKNGDEK